MSLVKLYYFIHLALSDLFPSLPSKPRNQKQKPSSKLIGSPMAAHHHHHHHLPPNCCSSCSFSDGCSCSNCTHNQTHHCCSPPLSSPRTDPLLQAIASQLLQSNFSPKFQRPKPRFCHQKESPHQENTHNVISSLVSRIEALEASLNHFPPSRYRGDFPHCSLRDVAARVIQTHFRAFLVRRSRTLRGLKDLALLKSAFNFLKSSVSSETHFDFGVVSRKAMDLLVKLDSIQVDDPMVRDGKRSISRDLVRFLDFIEGVAVKRHELSLKARKNVRFVPNGEKSRVILRKKNRHLDEGQKEGLGKLRERVEKIRAYTRVSENDDEDVELEGFQHVSDDDEEEENPIIVVREKNGQIRNGVLVRRLVDQPKVKKSVSFAENKNVLKIFSNSNEQVPNEDGSSSSTTSSDDQGEITENTGDEVEEIKTFSLGAEDDDEEAYVVNKATSQRIGSIPRRDGSYEIIDRDGEFVFSAPLPVQMEDKADLIKRRNELKILR